MKHKSLKIIGFLFLICLCSCDRNNIINFLKKYNDEPTLTLCSSDKIYKENLNEEEQVFIGSKDNLTLYYDLENPHDYIVVPQLADYALLGFKLSVDGLQTEPQQSQYSSSCYESPLGELIISQFKENSEKQKISFSLPKRFLQLYDLGRSDTKQEKLVINLLWGQNYNAKEGKYLREFSKPSIEFYVNEKPIPIAAAGILKDADNKLILAFDVPSNNDIFIDDVNFHSDIEKLKVTGTFGAYSADYEYDVTPPETKKDEFVFSITPQGGTITPPQIVRDYDTTWSNFDPEKKWKDSLSSFYILTDVLILEDDFTGGAIPIFTFTFIDSCGFESSFRTDAQPMPKLNPPNLYKDGLPLATPQNLTLESGDDSVTVTLKAPNVDTDGNKVSEKVSIEFDLYKEEDGIFTWKRPYFFEAGNDGTIELEQGTWKIKAHAKADKYRTSDSVEYILTVTGASTPIPPVITEFYVSIDGNDDTGDGTKEKPFATLARALEKVNDSDKVYTIYIRYTVTLTECQNIQLGKINAKSLTIMGEDPSATLTGPDNTSMLFITADNNTDAPKFYLKDLNIKTGLNGCGITINSSADVDITGCTIVGDGTASVSGVGLRIMSARVILNNTVVSNFETDSSVGGAGIFVDNGATLFMSGTTRVIYNKATKDKAFGGGILVRDSKLCIGYTHDSSGTMVEDNNFTGDIAFNFASSGGGVALLGSTTCLMSAGTIGTNKAVVGGNGISKYGGGMYLEGSGTTFTMEGGIIADNECAGYGGGVCVYTDATFTMKGGTIGDSSAKSAATESHCSNKANNGAGVYVHNATFTHTGGTISYNYAASYNIGAEVNARGGGVVVSANPNTASAKYTMEGSTATISYNGAGSCGGGIYMSFGNDGKKICTLQDGTIESNHAEKGGGFYSSNKYCEFYMKGGNIEKNNATKNGGAIFFDQGELSLTGGIIKSNTATTSGDGVYLPSGFSGNFTIGGAIEFDNASDIYFSTLATGVTTSYFTISKNLTKHHSNYKIDLKLELSDPVAVTNSGNVIATNKDHMNNLSNCFDVNPGYWKLALDNDKYKLAMDITKVTMGQIMMVFNDGMDVYTTDNENQDIPDGLNERKTQRLFLQFSDDANNYIEFYTAFELVFDGSDTITYSHSTFRDSLPHSSMETFTFDTSNRWCLVDFDDDGTNDISIGWADDNTIWIEQEFIKYYIFR